MPFRPSKLNSVFLVPARVRFSFPRQQHFAKLKTALPRHVPKVANCESQYLKNVITHSRTSELSVFFCESEWLLKNSNQTLNDNKIKSFTFTRPLIIKLIYMFPSLLIKELYSTIVEHFL